MNGGADLDQTYSNQASALTLFSRQHGDDDDHHYYDSDDDDGGGDDDDDDDDGNNCIHFGGHESFLMANL